MSTRQERVGEEIRAVIARALLSEIDDPRLSLVSITAVKASPDLGFAKVYWVPVDPATDEAARTAIGRAFKGATGALRREIARGVGLRVVPELAFVYDESIERGRKMDALLATLEPSKADAEEPQ